MADLWAESKQGMAGGGGIPEYNGYSGQGLYKVSCPAYSGCTAAGNIIPFPPGAAPSTDSDHHLADLVYSGGPNPPGEYTFWGGYQASEACQLTAGSPGTLTCSFGGFFPFTGDGTSDGTGAGGTAAANASAIGVLTASEANGTVPIVHALEIETAGLSPGGVLPGLPGKNTDEGCPSGTNNCPVYGQWIAIKPGVNVPSLGGNAICQRIWVALQTYGAAIEDNAGAITWLTENPATAGDQSAWNAIYSALGSDTTCLNALPASDLELLTLNQSGPPF